jgi:hypothetical protein
MHRLAVSLALLLTAAGLFADTALDRCTKGCSGTEIPSGRVLVLDANTGQRIRGKTTFSEGDPIQVILVNRNPFRYEYGYSSEAQELDIDIAHQFLSGLPGLSSASQAMLGVRALPLVAPGQAGPQCPGAEDQWKAVVDAAKPLTDNKGELDSSIKTLADASAAYTAFLEATKDASIPTSACASVCKQATELQQSLPSLINLDEEEKLIKAIKPAVEALPAAIKTFEEKRASLSALQKQNCAVDDILTSINELQKAAVDFADSVKALRARGPELRRFQQILDKALSSETSFGEVRLEEQLEGPTGITIRLTRRDLRAENAAVEQLPVTHLSIGEGALSISGGIFFSTLEDVQIQRVKSTGADGKLVDRFAEESNSNIRPAIAVLVNGRLFDTTTLLGWRTLPGTVALSTGVVLVNRNGTNETEYLIGPSWLLARRAITLSLAAHVGRVAHLGGDFKVGDEIPAGLTDPLPADHDWQTGIAFGVTFRTR